MDVETQAKRTLRLAELAARKKLGAAWGTFPHLRGPVIAGEILAIMAGKDPDGASAKTAQTLIATAAAFCQEH